MDNRNFENTGRVVAFATAFFGGLALLGWSAGVFDRLGAELTVALGVYGAGFAALTWHLDPGVRAYVKGLFARGSAARTGRTAPV
jgi:hypothetical protein